MSDRRIQPSLLHKRAYERSYEGKMQASRRRLLRRRIALLATIVCVVIIGGGRVLMLGGDMSLGEQVIYAILLLISLNLLFVLGHDPLGFGVASDKIDDAGDDAPNNALERSRGGAD